MARLIGVAIWAGNPTKGRKRKVFKKMARKQIGRLRGSERARFVGGRAGKDSHGRGAAVGTTPDESLGFQNYKLFEIVSKQH